MKKLFIALLVLFIFSEAYSTIFRFDNQAGRKYRFKNIIKQDIYRNGVLYKRLESMNKAMLEVLDETNHFGYYQGKYYYYEKNIDLNESFKLVHVYESKFYRDEQGHMVISREILMPSLRGIPIFPTNDVQPGDTWTAPGEEVHEGILEKENILQYNFDVNYKYIGDETNDGKVYPKISIDYKIAYYPQGDPDIYSITGFSRSVYYWDSIRFSPAFYNEDYAFLFTLKNGETAYYTGATEGKVDYVSDITNVQKQEIINEISNKISTNNGMSVKDVVDGIVVNLGNILFDINQATMKPEYTKKLESVADILRKYPGIDIVVSGYTDITGSENYNLVLSENRAKAVSDFLIKKGVSPTRISYIGYGSKNPIADNSSEEGRTRNRRVEIKLITKE